MFLSRLGSLNALEQVRVSPFWKKWLGGDLPSSDSVGRISAVMDSESIRAVHRQFYRTLKRNKGFRAPTHDLIALVIDGHESHSSRRRRCSGCLQRKIKTKNGVRLEFYHRNVTAMLIGRDFELLVDAEPQRSGEDEIAAAIRLFERVVMAYPRAFDVVVADAIYSDARFYKHVLARGKHALTVLKADQPTLLKEAQDLCGLVPSTAVAKGAVERELWDIGDLELPKLRYALRAVRCRETKKIRRQLTQEKEVIESEWFWLTSLPKPKANACTVCEIGRDRWAIENQGFNECVNRWHADHVYKHDATAILVFWLLCMTAFNLFQVFWARNLKPQWRAKATRQHVADRIKSELHRGLPQAQVARAPP